MSSRTIVYDHQIFEMQEFGGISRYFCEIAEHIGRTSETFVRVVAPLHRNAYLASSAVPQWGAHLRMRHVRMRRLYETANLLFSPPLIAAAAPDILHRTYYAGESKRRSNCMVLTVFDMIHELYPRHFAADDRTSTNKRRSIAAADHVICISHSTASDLQHLFGVAPEKITVTHLGFSAWAFAAPSSAVAVSGRPYFLYVGQRAGYKNFARLLDAYAASTRLRDTFDLVAFGGAPWTTEEQARVARLAPRDGAVRRLTGDDAALARAYAGAFAFVYPSEYEGFGIPPLEAMSCGCPVACSGASSIPEVVGDAALLFDATRTEAIRAAMETLADDAPRRAALIEAGKAQHRKFSWERCAKETLACYQWLLGDLPKEVAEI